jgi:ketosteroid isomerase-like protein
MKQALIATMVLVGLAWAAPFARARLEATEAEERRDIQQVLTAFETALTARSVDGVMATLVSSDDLTLFLPVPYASLLIDGPGNARKSFEIFFQDLPKQALFQVTRHQTVVQLHGDVALGYAFHSYYLNRGDLPRQLLVRSTIVLVKQGGQWRILHLHSGAMPEVKDYVPR